MNLLRKYLLRYQPHELSRFRELALFWLLIASCFWFVLHSLYRSEAAHADLIVEHNQLMVRFTKEQQAYFRCLTGEAVGRDKDGNALICGTAMEIKIWTRGVTE